MSSPLTPKIAAQLADAVYVIRETDNFEREIKFGFAKEEFSSTWDISQDSAKPFSATTGSTAINFSEKSGFGLVLQGKGTRTGETAVVIRGTDTKFDWVTDAKMAVEPGPTGFGNHAGFNRAYKSMERQLKSALDGVRGPVHVVGHSLGGAVASIAAADMMGSAMAPKLYTFGAPRAGLAGFASALTKGLKAENIYRAYSLGDPVPMVPLYPFRHAPDTDNGIRVGGSMAIISPSQHSMKQYISAVGDAGWTGLRAASNSAHNLRSMDFWLDQAKIHTAIPGSATGLYVLGKALSMILKKAGQLVGIGALGVASMVDTVAFLIERSVSLSAKIADRVKKLIVYVMRWAGKTIVETSVNITRTFLSYVLSLLLRPLVTAAQQALNRLHGS